MNLQDQKYQKKSKSISSAEPNYLCQFEMRYPVIKEILLNTHIICIINVSQKFLTIDVIYGWPPLENLNNGVLRKMDLSKDIYGEIEFIAAKCVFVKGTIHILRKHLQGTVAINELLCLKNVGAQVSLFFTSYE